MRSRKTKWLVVTHLVTKGLVDKSPRDYSRSPDFQISDAMYPSGRRQGSTPNLTRPIYFHD